jgi:hypothetical protein
LTVNASDTNRRYWDAMAAVHGQDAYYDTEALAAGSPSLGEIVTAALRAGLRIEALHEHLEVDRDPRGDMLAPEYDGRYRLRVSGERLPILYTLIAARP